MFSIEKHLPTLNTELHENWIIDKRYSLFLCTKEIQKVICFALRLHFDKIWFINDDILKIRHGNNDWQWKNGSK